MIEQINNQLTLLRQRMKLELNSNYDAYSPAHYHHHARDAMSILKGLNSLIVHDEFKFELAARIGQDCESIIVTYIRLLSNYVLMKIEVMRDMYVKSGHHELIRQIHEQRPSLMEYLVQEYPYAFMNMDDEWCAWVTLLK